MTSHSIQRPFRALKGRCGAFARHTGAVAAMELALVLPFLLLMFLGAIELSRFFMISKRVSNAAANMAQLLATSKGERTEGELSSPRSLRTRDTAFLTRISTRPRSRASSFGPPSLDARTIALTRPS
jgi:Flp pilus assembly protein TadG